MSPAAYQSYIVRMARDEQCDSDQEWHSEIKHIQSGSEYRFESVDDLPAFLRRQTQNTPPETTKPET